MAADRDIAARPEKGIAFRSSSLWEELMEHARRAAPEEACGILAGWRTEEGREVARVFVCRNAYPGDRRRRFLIDPEEQIAAQRQARESGLEIVGYYHSHHNGIAEMSEEDRRQAHPHASCVILAFKEGGFVEARSWRLGEDGVALEEPLRAPRVTRRLRLASRKTDGC